jgi:hypothetical protein
VFVPAKDFLTSLDISQRLAASRPCYGGRGKEARMQADAAFVIHNPGFMAQITALKVCMAFRA